MRRLIGPYLLAALLPTFGQTSFEPEIPRIWDDEAMRSWNSR